MVISTYIDISSRTTAGVLLDFWLVLESKYKCTLHIIFVFIHIIVFYVMSYKYLVATNYSSSMWYLFITLKSISVVISRLNYIFASLILVYVSLFISILQLLSIYKNTSIFIEPIYFYIERKQLTYIHKTVNNLH